MQGQTQSDAQAGKYSREFCMRLRNASGIAETEAAPPPGLVFVGGGSVGKRRHKVNRFERKRPLIPEIPALVLLAEAAGR